MVRGRKNIQQESAGNGDGKPAKPKITSTSARSRACPSPRTGCD